MNTFAATTTYSAEGSGTTLSVKRLIDGVTYDLQGFKNIRQVIIAPSLINQVLLLCGNNEVVSVNVATGQRNILIADDGTAPKVSSIAIDPNSTIFAVRSVPDQNVSSNRLAALNLANSSQVPQWEEVVDFNNTFSTFDEVITSTGQIDLVPTPEYHIVQYLLGLDGAPFLIASETNNSANFRVFSIEPIDSNSANDGSPGTQPKLKITPISGTLSSPIDAFVPVAVNATTFLYKEGDSQWKIWASSRDVKNTTNGNFIDMDTSNSFWSQRPENAKVLQAINSAKKIAVDQLLGFHTPLGSFSATDILQVQPGAAGVQASKLNSDSSPDKQVSATIRQSADNGLAHLEIYNGEKGRIFSQSIGLPYSFGQELINVSTPVGGGYLITFVSFQDRSSAEYAFNPSSLTGDDIGLEVHQISLAADGHTLTKYELKKFDLSDEILNLSDGSRDGLLKVLANLRLNDQAASDNLVFHHIDQPISVTSGQSTDLLNLGNTTAAIDSYSFLGSSLDASSATLGLGKDSDGYNPGYEPSSPIGIKLPPKYGSIKDAFTRNRKNDDGSANKDQEWYFDASFSTGIKQKFNPADDDEYIKKNSASLNAGLKIKFGQPTNAQSLYQDKGKSISEVKKEINAFEAKLSEQQSALGKATLENRRLMATYQAQEAYTLGLRNIFNGRIPSSALEDLQIATENAVNSQTPLAAAQAAVAETNNTKKPAIKTDKKEFKIGVSLSYAQTYGYATFQELLDSLDTFDPFSAGPDLKTKAIVAGLGLDFKFPIYGWNNLNIFGKISLFFGAKFTWSIKKALESLPDANTPLDQLSSEQQQTLNVLDNIFQWVTADGTPVSKLTAEQRKLLRLNDIRWNFLLNPLNVVPPQLLDTITWIDDKSNAANEFLTTIPPLSWLVQLQQQLDSLTDDAGNENPENISSLLSQILTGDTDIFLNNIDDISLYQGDELLPAADYLRLFDDTLPGIPLQVGDLLGDVEFDSVTGDFRIKNLGVGFEARLWKLLLTGEVGAYLDFLTDFHSYTKGSFGVNLGFELVAFIFTLAAKGKVQLLSWDTTQKSSLLSNQIFDNDNLSPSYRNILARENYSLDLSQAYQTINRNGLSDQSSPTFDSVLIEGSRAYGVLRLPLNVSTSQSGLISELHLYEGSVDATSNHISWNFKVSEILGTGLYGQAQIAGYDPIQKRPVVILRGISDDNEAFTDVVSATTSSAGKVSVNAPFYPEKTYTQTNLQNPSDSASMGSQLSIIQNLMDDKSNPYAVLFATSLPNSALSNGKGYQQGSVLIDTVSFDDLLSGAISSITTEHTLRIVNSDPNVKHLGKSISATSDSLFVLEDNQSADSNSIGWHIKDPQQLFQEFGNTQLPSYDLSNHSEPSITRLRGIFPNQRLSQYEASEIYALTTNTDGLPSTDRYLTSYLPKNSDSAVNHSTYLSLSDPTKQTDLIISNLTFTNASFGSDLFSGSVAADVSGTTDTLFVASEGYVGVISGNLNSTYPILPQPQVIKDTDAFNIVDYYLDFSDFRIAAQFDTTSLEPTAPITKDNLITAVFLSSNPTLSKLNGTVVNELIDQLNIEAFSNSSLETPVSLNLYQSKIAALFGGTSPLPDALTGEASSVGADNLASYKYARIGFATNNNPLEVAIVKNPSTSDFHGLSLATNDDDNASIVYLIFDSTLTELVDSQETMYLDPLLGAPRVFQQGIDGYAFSRGSRVAYTTRFYQGTPSVEYIIVSDPTASNTASNQGALYFIRYDDNFRRYVAEKSSQGTPIIDPVEYLAIDKSHGYSIWGSNEDDFFGTDAETTAPLTSKNSTSTQFQNLVLSGSPGSLNYGQLSELMNLAPTTVNNVTLPLAPGVAPALTKLVTYTDSTTLEGGTSFLLYVVDSSTQDGLIDSTVYARNLSTGFEQAIQKSFVGQISGISDIVWTNSGQPQVSISALDSKTGQAHILNSVFNATSQSFGEMKIDFSAYTTALPNPSVGFAPSAYNDGNFALSVASNNLEVTEGGVHEITIHSTHPAASKVRVTTLDKTAFANKDYIEHKLEHPYSGSPIQLAIETLNQPVFSSVRALDLVVEILDNSDTVLEATTTELKIASNDPIKLQNIGISNSVISSNQASKYIGLSATALPYYFDADTKTSPAAFLVGNIENNVVKNVELVVSSYNKGRDYNLSDQSTNQSLFTKTELSGNGFTQVASTEATLALASSNGTTSQIDFYKLPQSATSIGQAIQDGSTKRTLLLNGASTSLTTFDYNNKHYYTVSDPKNSKVYVVDTTALFSDTNSTINPSTLYSVSHSSPDNASGSFGDSVAFGKINNTYALVIGEPLANPIGSASSEAYGGAVHVVAIDDVLARKSQVDIRTTVINSYPKTITDESSDNYLTSYGAALGTSITFAYLFDKKDTTNSNVYSDQQQLVIGAPMANIGASDNIPGTVLVLDVKDTDATTSRIFVNGEIHRNLSLDIDKFIYTDQSKQDLKGTAILGAESGSGIGFEVLNAGKFTGGPKDVLALPSPTANLNSGSITMYAGNNAVINTVGNPDSVSSPLILNPQSFDDHSFAYIGTAQGATSQFSQSPTTLAQYLAATGSYSPTFNSSDKSFPSLFASNYSLDPTAGPGGYYLYGAPYLLPGDIIQSTDLGGSHGKVLTDWSSSALPIRAGDINLDGFADLAFYPVVNDISKIPTPIDGFQMPIVYGEDDNDLSNFQNNQFTAKVPYELHSNLVHGANWNPQSPIALSGNFQALSSPIEIGRAYDDVGVISFDVSPVAENPHPTRTDDVELQGGPMQYSGINFSWQINPSQGASYGRADGYFSEDEDYYIFEFEKNYIPYQKISSILAGFQTAPNDFFLLTKEGNSYAPQSNNYPMFAIHGFFDIGVGSDGERVISRDNLLNLLPNIPSEPGSPKVPDRGFITDSFTTGTTIHLTGYLSSPDNTIYSFVFAYDTQTRRSTSQIISTVYLTGDNAAAWLNALSNRSVINSAGDFNNDGLTDIVSLNGFVQKRADVNQNPFEYSVFYGDKSGGFSKANPRGIIPLPNQPAVSIAAIGDTNGDGASSLAITPLAKPDSLSIANYNPDQQFSFLLYPTEDNTNDTTLRKTGSSGDDLLNLTSVDLKSKPTTILLNLYQGSDSVTLAQLSPADIDSLGSLDYFFASLGSGDDVLNLDIGWLNRLLSIGFSLHGDQGADTLNITGTTNVEFELSRVLPHLKGFEFINLPAGSYSYDGVASSSEPIFINAPHGTTIRTSKDFATGSTDSATFNGATFNRVDNRGNLFLSSAFDTVISTTQDLDNDGADDTFEQGKDGSNDGILDSEQRSVATFVSSSGTASSLSILPLEETSTTDPNTGGRLNGTTSLIFQGLNGTAETTAGAIISGLQQLINEDLDNAGLPDGADVVLAVSDLPSFRISPEIVRTGTVDATLEANYRSTVNERFADTIQQVDFFFEEGQQSWNALFKSDGNGGYFFFGYNPDTGLGGILLDRDNDGTVDGARLYLQDNQLGDLNPAPYVIDDPVGLAALAEAPTLRFSDDGLGLIMEGVDGTGLWLNIEALSANAVWQNGLELITSTGTKLGAVGATANSENLGTKEIYLAAGQELRFLQSSRNNAALSAPNLRLTAEKDSFRLRLDDGGSNDGDFDDLELRITGSLTAKNPSSVPMARFQRDSADAILDLSAIPAAGARLNIVINSNASYTNRFGLVKLEGDSITGYSIAGEAAANTEAFRNAARDNLINPGDSVINATGNTSSTITWDITAADAGTYAAVLINPNGQVFTFGATASDGQQHVKVLGDNTFGFEDLLSSQNSDWDFNDFCVKVSFA